MASDLMALSRTVYKLFKHADDTIYQIQSLVNWYVEMPRRGPPSTPHPPEELTIIQ
jgi:hypothetical protein